MALAEAEARLLVTAKTEAAQRGIASLGGGLEKLNGNLNAAGKTTAQSAVSLASLGREAGTTVRSLAALGIAGVTAGLAFQKLKQFVSDSIAAAAEAERVMAMTKAVIQSTGGAAGMTANEIANLATEFSHLTAFEDEAIQSAENVLLRFTHIGRDVFPQALKATLDLAAAMGTDAAGAAQTLGIALESPADGMLRLRRAGIIFSEEEKEVIKNLQETGQAAEAQRVLLEKLSKMVGGQAAAAANTYAGRMEQLHNEVGNVQEIIGNVFIPVILDTIELFAGPLGLIDVTQRQQQEFQELKKVIAEVTVSYDDYLDRVVRTAVAQGQLSAATGRALLEGEDLLIIEEQLVKELGLLTEGEFQQAKVLEMMAGAGDLSRFSLENLVGTTDALTLSLESSQRETEEMIQLFGDMTPSIQDVTDSLGKMEANLGDLRTIMAGPLDREQENFERDLSDIESQIADVTEELEKLYRKHGKVITIVHEAEVSQAELSLAQFEAAESAANLAAAQQILAENTDPDQTNSLTEAVLRAQVAFERATGRADDYAGKLGSTERVITDYGKGIGELEGKLGELQEAKRVLAEEHAKATRSILFDMILEEVASDGLLQIERENLEELAKQWGIWNTKTALALALTQEAVNAFNIDGLSGLLGVLQGNAYNAAKAFDALTSSINSVPEGLGLPPPGPEVIPEGAQHGGSFIVPAGFHESFPVGPFRASSGEEVAIRTPAQQAMGLLRNLTMIVNAGPGMDEHALANQVVRRMQDRGLISRVLTR